MNDLDSRQFLKAVKVGDLFQINLLLLQNRFLVNCFDEVANSNSIKWLPYTGP